MSNILVVDDEPSICWALERLGKQLGHETSIASSAEEALELAAKLRPDVVILDVRLPGTDGLTAMKHFKSIRSDAPIIVITAFGDLKTAIDAVEQGAFEYVLKPFDLHEIRAAIERALCVTVPMTETESPVGVDGMLGSSPAMQAAFKRIALAAASDVAVLLSGESGVGKELAAHAIHRHSARRERPFVAVNMAALSPTLAEAELFGHVEGAFTGADQARKGLLVQADGGTLFIDEVADIPTSLQIKLLRALDQGEVLPVGADQPVKTRFRLASATHRNLHRLVDAGEFRHDLFYRLGTFEIALPPLRDRPQDIPPLARYFLAQASDRQASFADETIAELERRQWFGNVRELRKAVEHSIVLARRGVVLPSHLPPPLPAFRAGREALGDDPSELTAIATRLAQKLLDDPNLSGQVYDRFLHEIERPLLETALSQSGSQCAPAARILGLHRTTLRRKLEQHGIAERQNS